MNLVSHALMSLTTAGAVALVAGQAAAGPVNKNWVAADADWYIHVDLEAAVASTLGQWLVEHRDEVGLDGLDEMQTLGIDPFKDIKSITIFDRDASDDHAVVVASTTASVDKLVEMLTSDPNTKTLTVDGHSIIAFDDKGTTQYWHVRNGSNPTDRIVFLSDKWELVSEAAGVADGKVESLGKAGTTSRLTGDPGAGSVIFLRAGDIANITRQSEDENAKAIFGSVKDVQIDIGERSGECYAQGVVNVGKAEDATNIVQMGQGFLALGRMLTASDPETSEIANFIGAVNLAASEAKVTLSIKYPAKKLVDTVPAIKKLEERDSKAE